jgi:hypothetical protein
MKSLGEKEIEALSELHLFVKTWQFTLFHSFEGEWEVLSSWVPDQCNDIFSAA